MANKPNNPALWSRAKSMAKQKFDVYPSAYANGWAAKWYKSKGGTWRKAEYGMEIMKQGGTNNPGFEALPDYVQAKILSNMGYGGMAYPFMQQGGEPDGGMALGQIAAVVDKMSKLAQFIKPESDLEPWISSKLAVMDHYADAVSDYMTYNPEAQEEMMEEPEGLPVEEMKNGGGIPERYRKMGFSKVGVKKESTRPGKKWMVLAKKGDQYKVVHGGYDGMKDFSQHGSEQRKENFWNRMGGKNSAKAKDPFSPLYWHKRLGTWEDGGDIELPKYQVEGRVTRAANAQLRRSEKCDAFGDPYMGGASGGGGGRDASPSYANAFESLSDISNDVYFDKDRIKEVKRNRPQGVDKDIWNAINAEAARLNNWYTNKHLYPELRNPQTGKVDEKYLSEEMKGKVNIPDYYRYYSTPFKDKKSITPQDIFQYFQGQPGGVESFRTLINNNYMMPKQKKGGSTFSGNAWYRSGGGVPCYECGGMYANGGTNLRDVAMYMPFIPMAQNGMQAPPVMEDYPDYGSWKSAYDNYLMAGNNPDVYMAPAVASQPMGSAAPMSMMPDERDYPDYETYAAAVDQWMSTVAGAPQAQTVPVPTAAPAAQAPSKKAAPINYSGVSVVDLLTSVGKASDYNSRKQLAAQMGIDNYYGSAQQNMQLVKMITSNPDVLNDYKPAPAARSGSKTTASAGRPKATASGSRTASAPKAGAAPTTASAATEAGSTMFTPEFFANQKRNYLAANPNMSSEQYDAMVAPRQPQTFIGPSSKPMPAGPARDPMYYDDSYILNQIKNDPGTPANINKRKRKEFITNLAIGTLAPWLAEGALMALTTRYLPHGLKALPQVVEKARDASRALPAPMKRLPGPSPRGFVTETGLRSPGFPMYKKGGIHIKPENRGKFTASAKAAGMGVQEFAQHVLANKEDYSSTQVKRANFARNAAKWNKQEGGLVEGDVMDVTPEQLEMLKAQGYQFEII